MKHGFHVRNGLYFRRNGDDSVTVTKTKDDKFVSDIEFQITIDGDIWPSLIAEMSKYGTEDNKIYVAKIFHEADNEALLNFLNQQSV